MITQSEYMRRMKEMTNSLFLFAVLPPTYNNFVIRSN